MAMSKNGDGSGIEAPFVFVRHGDPQPSEWMARHPGWVSFPATLVTRPEPRSASMSRGQDRDVDAGPGGQGGFGPMSRPVAAGAPPVWRRRVPVNRLPAGSGRLDAEHPIAAYLRISDAMDRTASKSLAADRTRVAAAGASSVGQDISRVSAASNQQLAGSKPAAASALSTAVVQRQQPTAPAAAGTVVPPAAPVPAAPAAGGAADPLAPITADQLRAIMPDAGDAMDRYVGPLNDAMAAHGMTTNAQRAAFLAQIATGSRQLHDTVEGLSYTAHQITLTWPRRLPADAAAAPYAHNPEALSNHVYADLERERER